MHLPDECLGYLALTLVRIESLKINLLKRLRLCGIEIAVRKANRENDDSARLRLPLEHCLKLGDTPLGFEVLAAKYWHQATRALERCL